MEQPDMVREEVLLRESLDRSMDDYLPPSPAISTKAGEGDMSVSDLTSIGFDSNMSGDFQMMPSTPLKSARGGQDENDPLS
jgi:hypothetical protein